MHKTTLEQWGLLEKVVELGSFARAANATSRSQSSISYNLALLQSRLGVALLEPQGRKTVLTPAGEQMLARVRPLLKDFYHLETHASSLKEGTRTRLDMMVDTIFPRERLFTVLKQFQRRHTHTQIRLTEVLESASSDTAEADIMVLTRRQDVTGRGEWLMNIDFVAVAHSDHPLHQQPEPLSEEQLAAYPLICIAGREEKAEAGNTAFAECWTFSTIETAMEAVVCQVGYGWLPVDRIKAYLDAGTLKILPMTHGVRRATPLHLIVKKGLVDRQLETVITLLRQHD